MMASTDSAPMLNSGLAQKHLPILDGLRAVAVLLVILLHAGLPAPGGLGVLMFFVISGFLITLLLLREDAAYGCISIRNFYFRRMLRIFPAFYAYAALMILISLIFARKLLWPQAIASLTYVDNYYQAICGDPNTGFSHTWSLGVEEQFYLSWPALFFALRSNRRKLVRVLAVLIVIAWVYRAVLQFAFHVHQGWFYEAFDTRFDHLLTGCLLAVLLFRASSNANLESYLSNGGVLLTAFIMLVISALLESRFGSGYRDSIGFIIDPLLVAAMIPMLIAQRERTAVRWLDSQLVKYVGRISYSIYLYQQVVTEPAMKFFHSLPLLFQIAFTFGAVVIVASLSYYVIERPFLRLKNRRSRSESAEARLQTVQA